jgi:integrase
MSSLEYRVRKDGTKRYYIRDRIEGKRVTVVKDAGIWRKIALGRQLEYDKQKAAGHVIEKKARSLAVEDICDLYQRLHGPSLKGGKSELHNSPYYNLGRRLAVIKRAWMGKRYETISKYDVRDFLARFKTAASCMKYIATLTHMHRSLEDWNDDLNILPIPIKLPPYNPASKWRREMKPAQKKQLARRRVLTREEWDTFKIHLSPRARIICEIALRRYLRTTDIKQISHLSIQNGMIEGLQEKTGEKFSVPVLGTQPVKYDFTNFRKEFEAAQIAAGMNYPKEHTLHFTPRDLRRTGATWFYRKEKDLVGIKEMLGHTSTKTTELYLNIEKADKISIAQAMDTLVDAPLNKE